MKIVLSGVNLVEGGPLKVYKDAIIAFSKLNVELICIVHSTVLFEDMTNNNVEFIEYKSIKKSWFKRIYFEYFYLKKLSRELSPNIWLSMHDTSPRLEHVDAQFVYCHNPSPFYNAKLIDYKFDITFSIFTNVYKWLYKLNIKSNKAVIVQQSWLSDYFKKEFNLNDVFIAKPSHISSMSESVDWSYNEKINLFYPALPRTFKNFEILLKAISYLKTDDESIADKIVLTLTIDETMCPYAKYLYKSYKHLDNVKFIGMQTREEVNKHYEECDAVIFPSKLETWGLPITEAKEFNKPILLADLPYAHETLGCYHSAFFFDTEDHVSLANTLKLLVLKSEQVFIPTVFEEPKDVCYSWEELASKIITKTDM